MHAAPITPSPTAQTAARQALLMASGPTTTIAMAGSQYSRKTSHRLERMSRDSQVLALDSTLFLPYIQGYSRSGVQSRVKHNRGRIIAITLVQPSTGLGQAVQRHFLSCFHAWTSS